MPLLRFVGLKQVETSPIFKTYMSNPNDIREIVKTNAELYREAEESRQRNEDVGHFIAQHPKIPVEEQKILEAMAE